MARLHYADVLSQAEGLATDGWDVSTLAEADGYPLLVLTDPLWARSDHRQLPELLIAAGIHGEEPAGVLGLVRWLKGHGREWVGRLHMHVFPCLNPWGFERGIRYSKDGKDLNRQFDSPRHPAVRAFSDWIAGRRFDLFMDLHEDSDFESMYLYELLEPGADAAVRTLGRRILDRAAEEVPLSHGDEVGPLATEAGIVSGSLTAQEAREFRDRPIAIEVFAYHTSHVVTVETPGRLDLEFRVQLQVDALQTAAEYLVTRPAG